MDATVARASRQGTTDRLSCTGTLRRTGRSASAAAAEPQAGSSTTLPVPAAPVGKAPIGTITNRATTCASVPLAGSTRFGTVDVSFEYRHTRDTDSDGAADAAPEWVPTAISAYFYSDEEAAACG